MTSAKGNRHLLVVVDRATKVLASFPLPGEETLGVSRKLLELLLTFGVPLSMRCHPAGGFTSEVKQHPLPMAPGAPRLWPE